jgi:osmotically-inducible protein OsmY
MSDERIKKDLVDQLYWDDRIDASQVQVDVSDGKVTLTGSVPTYTARQAAESDGYTVLGVRYVENQLEVRYPEATSRLTDDEISVNIKSLLLWSPDVDATHISVDVASGLVTLDGSVDAYWKKQRVEELASSVMGVTQIINNLAVVPSERVTDQVIAESIGPALERDGRINVNTVGVEVDDGKVTLTGTVHSWTTYRAVEDIARFTPGVLEVRNDLIIS